MGKHVAKHGAPRVARSRALRKEHKEVAPSALRPYDIVRGKDLPAPSAGPEPEIQFLGLHDRMAVTVQAHTNKVRSLFWQFCQQWGLERSVVQNHGNPCRQVRDSKGRPLWKDGAPVFEECSEAEGHYHTVTWDVNGSWEAIQELLRQPWVIYGEGVENGRVGFVASGSGPEKVKAGPAKPPKGKSGGWLSQLPTHNKQATAAYLAQPERWTAPLPTPTMHKVDDLIPKVGHCPAHLDKPEFCHCQKA